MGYTQETSCLLLQNPHTGSYFAFIISMILFTVQKLMHVELGEDRKTFENDTEPGILYQVPMSLRAVSQGLSLTNSLNSCKFAFLKFRVLTLLFAWLVTFKTADSTRAWSLPPMLPPNLMSQISSLALVTIRSSIASSPVGLSITWFKKFFSVHTRSVLDCPQL